jgi:hypothetical protein
MTRRSFCKHALRDTYERKIASEELKMSKAAQEMNRDAYE